MELVGSALALMAAISVAMTNLFIRKGTDSGRAYDAVFIVMVVEVVLLTAPIAVGYYPAYRLTPVSIVAFAAAGLVGTMWGQIFHFQSIDLIGASRAAPIVASWALVSTVLGAILLDEVITAQHALGVICVVVGVAAIAWETSQDAPGNPSRRELLIGLALPFAAAVAYGLEPILAKLGLGAGTPAPVGLVVKTVAALIGFAGYLAWRDNLPAVARLRSTSGRWFVLAGVTTTLFLIGYYLGLALAPVSIVAPIVATNILFVVVLSAVFMPQRLERVTWRLVAAATVVVVGVVLITAGG